MGRNLGKSAGGMYIPLPVLCFGGLRAKNRNNSAIHRVHFINKLFIMRPIKVKVVKETNKKVTIRLISLNRNMPISKDDFEKRVKDGTYIVTH